MTWIPILVNFVMFCIVKDLLIHVLSNFSSWKTLQVSQLQHCFCLLLHVHVLFQIKNIQSTYNTFFDTEIPLGFARLICHGVEEIKQTLVPQKNLAKNNNIATETSNEFICSDAATDALLSQYNYQLPLEKEISALQTKIDGAKSDREELLAKLESYNTLETDGVMEDDLELSAYKCGNCHLRQNHKRNRCPNEKCQSVYQCRIINFHKEERKKRESLKAEVKKVSKNIKTFQAEVDRFKATLASEQRSFVNRIRPHLIRSNRKKYLIKSGERVVPASSLINLDSKILEFHYKEFPVNIEAEADLFALIIQQHHEKYSPAHKSASNNSSIENKLSEQLSKLHSPSKLDNLIEAVNKPLRLLKERALGATPGVPVSQVDAQRPGYGRRVKNGNKRIEDLNQQFHIREDGISDTDAEADVQSDKDLALLYARETEEYLSSLRSPIKKKTRQDLHRPKHVAPSVTYTQASAEAASPKGRSGKPSNVRKNLYLGGQNKQIGEHIWQNDTFDIRETFTSSDGEQESNNAGFKLADRLLQASERQYLASGGADAIHVLDDIDLDRESIVNKELAQKKGTSFTSTPQPAHSTWHTPDQVKNTFNLTTNVYTFEGGAKVIPNLEGPINLSISNPDISSSDDTATNDKETTV